MSWAVKNRFVFSFVLKQLSTKSIPKRTIVHINNLICTHPTNNSLKILPTIQPSLNLLRYKHDKKHKKPDLTESEDEEDTVDFDDGIVDKQTKVVTAKLNSLRADLILKSGLGIARNKIEVMFYESKIRVNGKKLMKKSVMLNIGDEVDIIKGPSATNPDFLSVARVEILAATERGDGLSVKLRRNKNLTIENYDE